MARDRRTVAVVVVLLLVAAGAGVAAGALFGGSERTPGRVALTGPAPSGSPGSPTTPAPTSARPAPKNPAPLPGTAAVPVYVLGGATWLYREFRAGTAGADAVRAAVAGLAEPPADPDYRTPWAGGRATVTRAGTVVTVTFAAAPALRSAAEARHAVQQVVYTVTAADPTVTRVRVVAPGLPAALTRSPAGRADQSTMLAPVWVLTPTHGGTAGRTVRITGTASVFEATVSLEVLRGGSAVATRTVTASVGAPARGEWTVDVPVTGSGDYTVSAFEVSAKDGSRVAVDTKRFTVS